MPPRLKLPEFEISTRKRGDRTEVHCVIRKKYIALTPEEWVRQNFVLYLINFKNYPLSHFILEHSLKVNQLKKRCDAVIFNRDGKPIVIVECKSADVKIDQTVFDQIARYNMPLKVDYLIVTNGIRHYCCKIDHVNGTYSFLEAVPEYEEINQ